MAKTRAQRKAEKRRRQQAQRQRQPGRPEDERAQRDTQNPVSGEVAEAEAVIESGARTEDYGEHVEGGDREPQARSAVPGVTPEPVAPERPPAPEAPEAPEAPVPSKADVGRPEAPAEPRESRRQRRAREKEERRKARAREQQRAREQKAAEKTRGPVIGFLASVVAELKKVQWPDRDTLVQASAVVLIFVAVMAAYLGALDAAFNWLIQRII